jgi:hypothetical protein
MAVTDLSHLATDSMWATSGHAGNRPSDPAAAMTAPGSPSPAVDEGPGGIAGGDDVSRQPFVQPSQYDGRHTTRGDR